MVARKPSGTALRVALDSADRVREISRRIGIAAFGVYVLWNVYWLSHRTLPPSILLAACGLPAPTTGGTRAAASLLRGDFRDSLYWNAFLVPIVLLLVASGVSLSVSLMKRRRLVLPVVVARLWLVVLASAWITKLLQGRGAW
jgi:hypothetical protein